MMLGLLLARAGISVIVLEKHADFLRDFRGDTIHPSTLEVMYELGLLDQLLRRPHQEVRQLQVQIGDRRYKLADFQHLPCRCRYIAFMPQWDLLDFLAEQAKSYPSFHLRMEAEVEDLLADAGRCIGVRARTPDGVLEVHADLIVGTDGRHSTVRAKAGFEVIDLGAPMDVLWFRIGRKPVDSEQTLGRIAAGRILIMINRGGYWQCAFVIKKGSFDQMRSNGFERFRAEVARLTGIAELSADELRGWDDVKLLTVKVDRLRQWYAPGVLCIGDAAHAMSPIGGVGINLAIQDAVAAGNLLAPHLRAGSISTAYLKEVQSRREMPVRLTQYLQVLAQNRVISNILSSETEPDAPFILKLADCWPLLRRLPARLIGLGFRPEHVAIQPAA
jgi:2-polyprenyl-6-methoxyphenol hydroxylase-like FAD-dependent oxidoreductase